MRLCLLYTKCKYTNCFLYRNIYFNKNNVVFEFDDVILRIRDDCVKFNLKDKCKTMVIDQENPSKNMGIRMVLSLAKDVRYTYTLNTNNLIITL